MKINNIIDYFREIIREISDDTVYSDQFLYEILLQSRAVIIKQLLSRNKPLSPYLYQRICVKLCPSDFLECSCTPFDFGCKVYRSVNPIPEVLFNDDSFIMNTSELWGNHINYINERSFRVSKYRKNKEPYFSYIGHYNNDYYMFILGDKIPPKYIKIEAVFIDPMEIINFQCDEDCPKPQGTGFPMDRTKLDGLMKMSLEFLGISMKMPEDRSNDGQSTLTEKSI